MTKTPYPRKVRKNCIFTLYKVIIENKSDDSYDYYNAYYSQKKHTDYFNQDKLFSPMYYSLKLISKHFHNHLINKFLISLKLTWYQINTII